MSHALKLPISVIRALAPCDCLFKVLFSWIWQAGPVTAYGTCSILVSKLQALDSLVSSPVLYLITSYKIDLLTVLSIFIELEMEEVISVLFPPATGIIILSIPLIASEHLQRFCLKCDNHKVCLRFTYIYCAQARYLIFDVSGNAFRRVLHSKESEREVDRQ